MERPALRSTGKLRLHAGGGGAGRGELHGGDRPVHGPARAQRCGQDHADGAGHPPVPAHQRPDRRLRPRHRHRHTAALASMGVVFQRLTLDLDLTVDQNLRYAAALYGIPPAAAKEPDRPARDPPRPPERRRAMVRTLSGGYRRRVEIAHALLHRTASWSSTSPRSASTSRAGPASSSMSTCSAARRGWPCSGPAT